MAFIDSNTLLLIILAGAVSAGLTVYLLRNLDRRKKRDAESEAKRILDRAEHDAANRVREADLEIKERMIRERTQAEREIARMQDGLRERERLIEKRQEVLEQQTEDLRKQEKIVESTQRKLTERIQDANRRKDELAKLLDLQRQTLHELSGLTQEEATRRLLEMLERPTAAGDRASIILRHEKRLAEDLRAEDPRDAADLASSATPPPTPPKPPPARWTFPTTK